jgi:Zn-dependent protease with chaperone function
VARPAAAALALVVAALAAVWAVAAWWLWHMSVPDGLRLPEVAAADVLPEPALDEARDFERFLRWSYVASAVVLVGAFAVYARYGVRFARESAAGRIGTGMLLGMLGFAVVWLVQVPFGILDLWWQRRHDVSELGFLDWLVLNWFALGGEFLFVCFALLVVMGLAGPLGDWWWIPGAAVFVGLVALFTFVSPYLIPAQMDPPRALVEEADDLAEEQGLPPIEVQVQEVDSWESPNAAATGLGPSRRVILWNTLVNNFDDDEVRVVLAHELGHHSRDHLAKSIAWYTLFAVPGAFLIAWATKRRGGMREPAAVPLALLVLVVLQLLALPVQNAITRNMEAEADWVALETTEDPEATGRLWRGFAKEARVDPSPPTWSYLLFDTHPSMAKRVAMAEAWRERNGR